MCIYINILSILHKQLDSASVVLDCKIDYQMINVILYLLLSTILKGYHGVLTAVPKSKLPTLGNIAELIFKYIQITKQVSELCIKSSKVCFALITNGCNIWISNLKPS